MIIVAGWLRVVAAERDAYLAAVFEVTVQARGSSGCFDFVQAADPVEPDRINVYERWESDADLLAFRSSGPDEGALPEIRSAEVHKFRISAIEPP